MHKVLISWSTGKDSAYTLYKLKQLKNKFEVVGLVSTITKPFDRVSIHGVRRGLLEAQAQELQLPLHIVEIPFPCSNELYTAAWKNFFKSKICTNVSFMAFGDIFLENIRHYREINLAATAVQPIFPLWHKNTKKLAAKIMEKGFKAIVTCIDTKKLDASFVGRIFNQEFLHDLPQGVDPCGENGEFHTFVYDAPLFRKPIDIVSGEIVEREGYIFLDLGSDTDRLI